MQSRNDSEACLELVRTTIRPISPRLVTVVGKVDLGQSELVPRKAPAAPTKHAPPTRPTTSPNPCPSSPTAPTSPSTAAAPKTEHSAPMISPVTPGRAAAHNPQSSRPHRTSCGLERRACRRPMTTPTPASQSARRSCTPSASAPAAARRLPTGRRCVQIDAGSACAVVALLVEAVWTAVVDLRLELVVELPGAAFDPVVGDFAGGCDGQDGVAGERDWLAVRG
jgi:hypothetical protein